MKNKIVLIKKPASLIKEQSKAKSMENIWTDLITWVMDNPESSDDQLFNLFGPRSGVATQKSFIHRCKLRGLSELRLTCLGKKQQPLKDAIQLTEKAIQDFTEARRKKGIVHLGKMDAAMQPVYKALEKQEKKINTKRGLSQHLSNLSTAHKLGKDVYDIDSGSGAEKTKVNLAIMMNFDPSQAQQGKVIDI